MEPIATAMTPEQRAAAAVYYASLPPNAAGVPSGLAVPARDRGSVLATIGDSARGVQACANCHGPGGIGSGDLYPYLAGQHPGYLSATLGAWRDGTRNNDPSGQMPVIAKSAGAAKTWPPWLRTTGRCRRAAKPMDAERMAAPASAPAPAVSSGPRTEVAGAGATTAPAAAAGGAGITQGSATTGGAQGPGGGGGTGPTSTGNPAAASSPPPPAVPVEGLAKRASRCRRSGRAAAID